MSRARQLLQELHDLGVAVTLTTAGKVHVEPDGVVPDTLWPELTAHRDELAELLRAPDAAQRLCQFWSTAPESLTWPPRVGDDPRPDLPGSPLWSSLLALAAADANDPQRLYGSLHGFRCCGAVLEPCQDRWRLAPTIDPNERVSIWHSWASWDRDCSEWLRLHGARLRELLAQVSTTARPTDLPPDG